MENRLSPKANELFKLCKKLAHQDRVEPIQILRDLDEDWSFKVYREVEDHLSGKNKRVEEAQLEEVIETFLKSSIFKQEMKYHKIDIKPGQKEVKTFQDAQIVRPITSPYGLVIKLNGQEFHITISEEI